jgi:hypothetical protein
MLSLIIDLILKLGFNLNKFLFEKLIKYSLIKGSVYKYFLLYLNKKNLEYKCKEKFFFVYLDIKFINLKKEIHPDIT